ncbi:MAG TPA: hypothetical protein VLY04_25235 [Bryobacteraceae bacterium]|nr:hypothetical protein [Bryobacteraceae bacterium]
MPLRWSCALALALAAGQAKAAAAPARLHAVWVYSVANLPSAVTDAPTRATLIQSSAASGVNLLYVSVYSSTPNSAKRYMYADSDIAALITAAHAQGIQVYAAYGDTDWPTLGCAAGAFPMARLSEVIAYDAANKSAAFDGVILDVEPGSNPDASLLTLYQCFRQQAQANGLGLAAAISAFWTGSVTFGQVTKPLYQQVVDLKLNGVVVMGYRNFAGTTDCSKGDGIVCLDQAVVAYANQVSQANLILVGLDTDNPATSGSVPLETFFSLGQAAMNAAAQSVSSQFTAGNESFGGYAIHNYRDSYLNGQLAGWPATNTGLLPPKPQLSPAGVVNAAGYTSGNLAPGELIDIFGTNLGPAALETAQVTNQKLTTNLDGVQVLIDGIPAPLVFASAGQAAAVVPFEAAAGSTASIQVVNGGAASVVVTVPAAGTAPGIFTADASGKGQGAILNQDYSLNSTSNPAAPGSVVVLYMTGMGAMSPATPDGYTNPDASALSKVSAPVTAQIGGVAATVLYAGSGAGIVSGAVQVNVVVPGGLAAGPQPVTVTAGGVPSQAGVTVAVRQAP